MRYLALMGAVLLGSCVSDGQGYVQVRGRTNPDHLRFTLAQCQGEGQAQGAAVPVGFFVAVGGLAGLAGSLVLGAAQQQAATSACMARNGYVAAQQAQPVQQAQANRGY